MMNRTIFLSVLFSCLALGAWAQDSIQQSVTVERELQPTVKASEKLATKPQEFQPTLRPTEVVYSDYSQSVGAGFNVSRLGYAETRFRQPVSSKGFFSVGAGYSATSLDFSYRLTPESGSTGKSRRKAQEGYIDLFASHYGQWGRKALAESELGFAYTRPFSAAVLSFGAEGGNEYFSHYYRYMEGNRFVPGCKWAGDMLKADKQANWTANAFVAVTSAPGADIRWHARAAYEGTYLPEEKASEHALHAMGGLEWQMEQHHAGAEVDVHDRFFRFEEMVPGAEAEVLHGNNHRLHLEPFYGYEGDRVRVHAGVNLDMSLGRGRVFGASPNVSMEAFITKEWLAVFADAKGRYGAPSVREELEHNRFLEAAAVMRDSVAADYTPIDLVVGLRMRPVATLLLDIYAGYSYTLDSHVCGYNELQKLFFCSEQDVQRAKVGLKLHYHYQDMITLNVGANYYFQYAKDGNWTAKAYDHADWDAHVRLDGRINSSWSLYSDNYLVGRRRAMVVGLEGARTERLRPYFDLNLGVQYTLNKWLALYAQVGNYLAWTEQLTPLALYNTPTQGANCLLGINLTF